MLRLIFATIWSRRERMVLILVSTVLTAAAFALFASASSATTLTADRAVNTYWRTTYDILVRAPDAVTPIEHDFGLLEANHLSGTRGGITREQWEQIRRIPGIEVAAPIAMVGYMFKPQPWVTLESMLPSAGIYQVSVTSTIDSGYQPLTAHVGPYNSMYFESWGPTSEIPESEWRKYAAMGLDTGGYVDEGYTFSFPEFNDYTLLAAIDPQEEAKLFYIDQQITDGRYFRDDEHLFIDEYGSSLLPLLMNEQDYVHTTDTLEIERIVLPQEGIPGGTDLETSGGAKYLASLPREPIFAETFTARDGLRSSFAPKFVITPIRRYTSQVGYGSSISSILVPDGIEYRIADGVPIPLQNAYDIVLEAVPLSVTADSLLQLTTVSQNVGTSTVAEREWSLPREVTFRHLDPLSATEFGYIPSVIGTFDVDQLKMTGATSPNQVPLETYFPPFVALQYDAQGQPLPAAPTLRPTLNDEGYLVAPPDALTTLDAAEQMLTRACLYRDPEDIFALAKPVDCADAGPLISAIRVRVSGITELTPDAQAKIERIAQDIMEQTGLHVDIMVGSSPQRVLVRIPGFGDVPALGYVEEGWVKKNVATLVTTGINRADTILLSTTVLGCLLYLLNTNYLSVLGRLSEFGVLRAIGWRRRDLFTLVLGEALLLGALSGVLGTVLALAMVRLLNLSVPLERVLFIIPLTVSAFVGGALLPAFQAARISPMTVMRSGETASTTRERNNGTLLGFALNGLFRRPSRTIASLLGLSLSAALLVFLKLVLDGLGGALYATLLGTWVRTEIAPYHFAMGAVTLLASMLAVAEVMLLNLSERRREIGVLRAVGWRRATLFRAFLLESGLLGLIGGVIGTSIALIGYVALYQMLTPHWDTWLQILLLGIVLPVGVALLGVLYPATRAARLMPLEALRGEERLGSGRGLTQATMFMGVAGIASVLGIITLAWSVGGTPTDAPTLIAAAPTPTATPTLAPAAAPLPTPTPVDEAMLPQYTLSLVLNTSARQLKGEQQIVWTNHTTTTLTTLAVYLFENSPEQIADGVSTVQRLMLEQVRVNGQSVTPMYDSSFSTATLPLPNPLLPEQTVRVALTWTLDIEPYGDDTTPEWVLGAFYPIVAYAPINLVNCAYCEADLRMMSESGIYDVTVTAPSEWTLVASSDPTAQNRNKDGTQTLTYHSTLRYFALAASTQWEMHSATQDGLAVRVFAAANDVQATEALRIATDAAAWYTRQFGALPQSTVNIVLQSGVTQSGRAYPNLIQFQHKAGRPVEAQWLAREVAQQWWYNVVGNHTYHEPWLATALANYAGLLYVEQYVGRDEFQAYLRSYQDTYNRMTIVEGEDVSVGSDVSVFAPEAAYYFETLYVKGSLFMHALRERIGDNAFFKGWRTYYEQYRNGIGTTIGFKEAMEQASGKDLTPLFTEWGIPGEIP